MESEHCIAAAVLSFRNIPKVFFDTDQSEHDLSKLILPKPEFYVIFSGNDKVPDEISLKDDFFDGDAPIDMRVKIITEESTNTISGQYIGFCRVFDEQRRANPRNIGCVKETIRICKEIGFLARYLKNHETEAITMMEELFNEEYLREQYDKSARQLLGTEVPSL